jgi:4-hydroxy-tetrahydrodipicolinate synthase
VGIAAAVAAQEIERAQTLQHEFDRYTDTRKRLPLSDIAFAKAAVAARLPGFPAQVRPPLIDATPQETDEIHSVMVSMMPLLTAPDL